MAHLFRAEWQKILGNRLAVGGLVWIFPATALLLIVFALLAVLLSDTFRQSMVAQPPQWTTGALGIWEIANSPFFVQPLILAFTAVVFAGEYQWSMWKNLLPRSRRTPLILTKFFAVAAFVVLSFVLMTVIVAVGQGIVTVIAGGEYGPPLTEKVISDFTGQYLALAGIAFATVLIGCGYTAIAAMRFRSILGGVLVGFLIAVAEWAILLPMVMIANLFHFPEIGYLYFLTPSYNLQNLNNHMLTGQPITSFLIEGAYLNPWLSLGLVVLWVLLLIGATVHLFRKQDITT